MHSFDHQPIDTSNTTFVLLALFFIYVNNQTIVQPFSYIIIFTIYLSSSDQPLVTIKSSVIKIGIMRNTYIL